MTVSARLVSVGDELCSGATADTSSGWLARTLEDLGVTNRRTVVVGDDEDVIAEALRDSLARADVVIVTGGLGPTEDDQTRHAAAAATGRPLELSEDALAQVRAWYAGLDRPMPDANRRQALLPRGADVLPNACGTAPGFALEHAGALLCALPGPPGEMRAMFDAEVRPRVLARVRERPELRRLQLSGLSESVFADQVGDWMRRGANPLCGCSVKDGVLDVVLRATGPDAAALADARAAELRARFAPWFLRAGGGPIEAALGELLIARGITVTAAESCTAGLVAARLASVPGISAVLGASFVTYSDDAKVDLLGVARETLARRGAVSVETAAEMAAGAARRAGARAAVAVTGIAGPGGGSAEKPVGTVAFATALDGDVRTELRRLPPSGREAIRAASASLALVMLYRRVAASD